MAKPQVGIVIGSISDKEYIMETCKILDFFDIQYSVSQKTRRARDNGVFTDYTDYNSGHYVCGNSGNAIHND